MFIRLLQLPIRIYTGVISPLLGPRCRFHPTCSAYALKALETHGVLRGLLLSAKRIGKCHPWCQCGWDDPVPKVFDWAAFMGYNPPEQPETKE
ncbi:MAG TPA: membrane protein insertion efficiency factor YidD [Rhodospirillaceae bacterium]|nr:membrane protein insertion efficiency factor YidD [Rhodospirillaceae bacterium]